jgi:uncharacterized protein (TIGR02266 family)
MDPQQPDASPRGNRRVAILAEVRLEFERFSGFLDEMASNLSEGGMFVRTRNLRPVGSRLRFEISLSDHWPLVRGTGEVMWTRWRDGGPQEPAGMGVRFEDLDDASRELIGRVVAERRRAGHSPFDLEGGAPPAEEAAASADATDDLIAEEIGEPVPIEMAAPPTLDMPIWSELPEAPPLYVPERLPPISMSPPLAAAVGRVVPTERGLPPTAIDEVRSWALGGPMTEPSPKQPGSSPIPAAPAAAATTWLPEPTVASAPAGRAIPVEAGPTAQVEDARSPTASAYQPREDAALPRAAAGTRSEARRRSPLVFALMVLVIAALVGAGAWYALRFADAPGEVETEGTVVALDSLPTIAEPSITEAPPAPPGAVPDVAAPAAADAATAATAAAPKPFTVLERVTWEEVAGGTQLTLWLDGSIPRDAIRHSRLNTGGTRELLQLVGARRAFAGGRLDVSGRDLLRVRTGFHQRPGGAEQHVVLDLTGPGVSLLGIDVAGNRVLVRLGSQ